MRHSEGHFGHRVGWLRAMVLGANDGIISTAALLLGVAAADSTRSAILTAGMAGLVAGAVSMALGEYVSVSSQRDTERSDIAKETWELEHQADHELEELTGIYQAKGLAAATSRRRSRCSSPSTTRSAAHLRDELGISRRRAGQAVPGRVEFRRRVRRRRGDSARRRRAGRRARCASPPSSPSPSSRWSCSATPGARLGGAKPGRPIARVVVRRHRRHGGHHAGRQAVRRRCFVT